MTLILQTIARLLLPLMLLISLFVLARGHNAPGGGFVGGLMAAAALTLYAMAHGMVEARHVLRANPITILGTGLLIALSSGLPALAERQPFMTGQWASLSWPGLGEMHLGTPLLFDVGVYLTVLGMLLTILFTLEEQ